MNEDPSSLLCLSTDSLDTELFRRELDALHAASLPPEPDRYAQMGAEIARLHASLREAGATVQRLREERDVFKKQLDDQLMFRRGPLEAQLDEAKRALFEQRLQFRSIVDVLAAQRDWVREWAIQCQENARLRDQLTARDEGTEANGLRRELLDAHAKLAEVSLGIKQGEAVVAVHESKMRSFRLENERLVARNNLLQEQVRRLWNRLPPPSGPAGPSPLRCEMDEGMVRHTKRRAVAQQQGLAETTVVATDGE
jgi:chromosome segregation ATPase